MKKLFLVLAFAGLLVITTGVKAAVLKVDDDHVQCPDAAFTTISDAVAAASPGDTIKVCAGTYLESVTIDKTLTLQGAGPDPKDRTGDPTKEAIVTGLGLAPVGFTVTADGVVIDGFTFQQFSGGTAVITADAFSGYLIRKNLFRDNLVGLDFDGSGATKSVVRENVFAANNNGIGGLLLHNATIEHNSFSLNFVAVVYERGAVNVTISHNTSKEDGTFIGVGDSTSTEIDHNDVSKSNGPAILVFDNNNGLVISHNDLSDGNAEGISFQFVGEPPNVNVEVSHNEIRNFHSSGIAVDRNSLMTSKIFHNHINNNGEDGIFIDLGNTGNFITDNEMMKNVRFDAHDASVGAGTAGTANFWANNHCKTSSPAGLCK